MKRTKVKITTIGIALMLTLILTGAVPGTTETVSADNSHHRIIYHVPDENVGTAPDPAWSETQHDGYEVLGPAVNTRPASKSDYWSPVMLDYYDGGEIHKNSFWCKDLNDPTSVVAYQDQVFGETHLYSKWRKVDRLIENVGINVWAKAGDKFPKSYFVENEELKDGLISEITNSDYEVVGICWDPENYDNRDKTFVLGKTYKVRLVVDLKNHASENEASAFFKGWTKLGYDSEHLATNPEESCPLQMNGTTLPFDKSNGAAIENCFSNGITYYFYYTVPAEDPHKHIWDAGKVTKPATTTSTGTKTYTCVTCGAIREETIDRLPDPAKQYGTDGTPVGPGASEVAADKAITGMTSDSDIKGAKFAPLKLRSTSQGKTSVKLTWTKNRSAVRYVLYGNLCNVKGKKYKPVKLATLYGGSYNVKKIGTAKVKNGKYYKFILVALDSNNNVVSTTKTVHVATKGGKVGNYKNVVVKAKVGKKTKVVSKVSIKKNKSLKLNVKLNPASKKYKVQKHVGVRYETSNPAVASVSGGKIKAKGKGTCTIYVFAQNGVNKAIKVTVK